MHLSRPYWVCAPSWQGGSEGQAPCPRRPNSKPACRVLGGCLPMQPAGEAGIHTTGNEGSGSTEKRGLGCGSFQA